jgi:hypothetical protein
MGYALPVATIVQDLSPPSPKERETIDQPAFIVTIIM